MSTATMRKSNRSKSSGPSGPVQQTTPKGNLFDQLEAASQDRQQATSHGVPVEAITSVETRPADKLLAECCAMKIRWPSFQRSRQVDKKSKSKMAQAVGAREKGFSSTKKLMDSGHPAVKAANELVNRVRKYVGGLTLPVVQLGTGANVQEQEANAEKSKKEGGVYLIKLVDLEEFDTRMQAFQSELDTMAAKLTRDLPDIMRHDRELVGEDMFNPDDYPEAVELPLSYRPVNLELPTRVAQFAPKMFERERQAAKADADAIYQGAVMEFLEMFKAVIESWVQALGAVVRIYPPEGHRLHHFHDAEVMVKYTHAMDPSIPEGKVRLKVKRRTKENGERKDIIEFIGPFSTAEYADLQPSEAIDQKRTFKQSTIENLTDMLAKYRRIGEVLQLGTRVDGIVAQIQSQLTSAGETAEDIGEELRRGRVFKTQTQQMMVQAMEALTDEIETVKRGKRKLDRTQRPAGAETEA